MTTIVQPGIKVETYGREPDGVLRDIAMTLAALDDAPVGERAEIVDDIKYLLTKECREPWAVVTMPGKGRRCVHVDRHGDVWIGRLGQHRETLDPGGGVRIGRTGKVRFPRGWRAGEE